MEFFLPWTFFSLAAVAAHSHLSLQGQCCLFPIFPALRPVRQCLPHQLMQSLLEPSGSCTQTKRVKVLHSFIPQKVQRDFNEHSGDWVSTGFFLGFSQLLSAPAKLPRCCSAILCVVQTPYRTGCFSVLFSLYSITAGLKKLHVWFWNSGGFIRPGTCCALEDLLLLWWGWEGSRGAVELPGSCRLHQLFFLPMHPRQIHLCSLLPSTFSYYWSLVDFFF